MEKSTQKMAGKIVGALLLFALAYFAKTVFGLDLYLAAVIGAFLLMLA